MKIRLLSMMATAVSAMLLIPGVNAVSVDDLVVPEGFKIEIFAEGVKNARQMALGDNGTIFVGSRDAGLVHAVIDKDGDYKADEVIEIAKGLVMPSGLAFYQGDLYVAEVHQVVRFKQIEAHLKSIPKAEVVIDDLPSDRHHGWKFIQFDDQGKLYVPVGAPCNVCDPDANYSRIFKYDLATKTRQTVAQGVRNSVGFDWHPQTNNLWFSDNGRDLMGDDIPPCEINHVTQAGQHFGYPYFHGTDIADPEFGKGKKAEDYVAPALNIQAHSAPLGISFYQGKQFPDYQSKLFIAEHGSWNRSKKVGYRVTVATIEEGKVVDYQPFVSGWLQPQEKVTGRPVAFLTLPDGSLLISDDFANAIYRVTYQQ